MSSKRGSRTLKVAETTIKPETKKRAKVDATAKTTKKQNARESTPPSSSSRNKGKRGTSTPPTVEEESYSSVQSSSRGPGTPRRKRKFEIANNFAELSRSGTVTLRPFTAFADRAAKTATSKLQLATGDGKRSKEYLLASLIIDQLKEGFHSRKDLDLNGPTHHWVREEDIVPVEEVQALCEAASAVLLKDSTLVRLRGATYIVGDLHGNYRDLKGFEKCLFPLGIELATAHVLFLGDYVDRGFHQVEVALHLLALKVMAPEKMTLLRGNHEDPDVNGDVDTYGEGSFRVKCKALYGNEDGEAVFEAINKAFSCMPLAAVVEDTVFCVHGGIPRQIEKSKQILEDIRKIQRPMLKVEDPFCIDLLWNDPVHNEQERKTIGHQKGFGKMFGPNPRGPDVAVWGQEALERFFEQTGCTFLIRAHEKNDVGFAAAQGARVLTVFSSSHYAGSNNQASIILIESGRIHVILTKKE